MSKAAQDVNGHVVSSRDRAVNRLAIPHILTCASGGGQTVPDHRAGAGWLPKAAHHPHCGCHAEAPHPRIWVSFEYASTKTDRLTGTRSARDPQPTRRWNVGFRFGSDCTLDLPTTTEPPVRQSKNRRTTQGRVFTEKPPMDNASWTMPSAGHCKHSIQSPSSALADVASLRRTRSIDICRVCGSAALPYVLRMRRYLQPRPLRTSGPSIRP